MKRYLSAFAAVIFVLAGPARAEGFIHADHQKIVDGEGNPILLRGIGLGGWLVQEGYMLGLSNLGAEHVIRKRISDIVGTRNADRFYRSWRDSAVTKADIDAMSAWGFNSVRVPLHWSLFMSNIPADGDQRKIRWKTDGFRRIDALVGWLKANGMVAILDLHATPGGQGNDLAISDRDPRRPSLWGSAANRAATIALWTKIAGRYRAEPTIAGYDLLNEPNWGFQDSKDVHGCKDTANRPLRDLYGRIIRAIRRVDKNHMLIIEGNCWGSNFAGLLPVADRNTALSFHKYWTPTTEESIASFLELRKRYDMPLWVGESGENNNDWYTRAVRLYEGNDIGWSWWPLKKIGANNPLEIPDNADYRALASYLRGNGPRPTARAAFAGLMKLAASSRFGNNISHPDVVDALLRAPHASAPVPLEESKSPSP